MHNTPLHAERFSHIWWRIGTKGHEIIVFVIWIVNTEHQTWQVNLDSSTVANFTTHRKGLRMFEYKQMRNFQLHIPTIVVFMFLTAIWICKEQFTQFQENYQPVPSLGHTPGPAKEKCCWKMCFLYSSEAHMQNFDSGWLKSWYAYKNICLKWTPDWRLVTRNACPARAEHPALFNLSRYNSRILKKGTCW